MRDCDFEKKDLDDYSAGMGMGGFRLTALSNHFFRNIVFLFI